MSGLTRQLAAFGADLTYEDLPPEVVRYVLLLTLDQVGAQLAGSTLSYIAIVRGYALDEAAPGRSTVIGSARAVRPEWAAFSNASAGHGIEIDDYHNESITHPGSVAVPSVLAMAEDIDANGQDTVTSLALAFEGTVRVGLALQPSMTYDRGFHGSGPPGVFGAALGAGRIVGLDHATMASALGLAGSHASGTAEHFGSGGDVKRLHGGLAAMGGVRAVGLARRGFRGPATILEGRHGILRAFAEKSRPDAILDGLGQRWELLGTALKPYCCCGLIHAPIEALRTMVREDGLSTEDVQEIVIGTSSAGFEAVGRIGPRPSDMTGAQFSLHYSLGMALALGGNDFSDYRAAQDVGFDLPEVLRIAECVRLEPFPEADVVFPKSFIARVRVTRRDGSALERVALTPGTTDAPLSAETVRAKYRRLATMVVGERVAAAVERAIDDLPQGGAARSVLAAIREASGEAS